jgi:L-aminoadipate-semialdehyde dehydrogenase
MTEDVSRAQFNYLEYVEKTDDPTINAFGLRLPQYPAICQKPIFFVTGVTGFLGGFILDSLVSKYPECIIYCLVRASSEREGGLRIQNNLEHLSLWNAEKFLNLIPICGNLKDDHFGLSDAQWNVLCESVTAIIHNGALVKEI